MKKTLFFVIFVIFLYGESFAYYDFASGGFYYKITSGNKVMVTYPSNNSFEPYSGYGKPIGSKTIPSTVTYGTTTYSVTAIDQWTFSGCSGLTSIAIPSSVTGIGYYAFKDCSGLTSITVDAGNAIYDSRDNCNAIIYTATNKLIVGCKTTVIPNTVTSIGDCAFLGCSGLLSINIPNSVTTICECAFQNCTGLNTVSIGSSVTSIELGAFSGCSGLSSINIPNSVTTIGNKAFQNCSSLTSFIIPNTVSTIGLRTFYGCSGLTSITIGNSVAIIDSAAFQNCSNLTSVIIPNSVTTIGGSAFQYCWHLTSVNIPNLVSTIGNRAFQSCSGLTTVTIGSSVTNIGDYAFYNCSGLTSVFFNASNCTYMGSDTHPVFGNCNNLAILNIGDNVTRIPPYGFYGCSNLSEIYSQAVVAPLLVYSSFYQVSSTLPLHIPCGCTESYLSRWGNYFSNFIEPTVPSITVGVMDITMGHADILSGNCDSSALIEAYANYGYHFVGWNDGDTNAQRIITLTQDTSFIALFAKNVYVVSVVANENARGSVMGGDSVEYLDSITISATPNQGYHFTRWQDYNTNNPRRVQVTQNKTYTAYFDYNLYSIVLMVDTSIHGTVSGAGDYNYLSNRTITANPNHGYHFTVWSDGDTNNPRIITLTQDTSFTAFFEKNQYTVNGVPSHNDRGNVTGGNTVDYLDSIILVATSFYGFHFNHWNDLNTDNPRQIQVTQDQIYTAYFDYNQYEINLSVDSSVQGTCLGGGIYNYLSACTITASANYGYYFTQWNDGNTDNPRTITLTQDTSFTAQFSKNQYTINVVPSHTDRGCVTGGATVNYLDSVTVAAVANYGYHFDHWSDGNTDNPHTFAATQDSIITAYFVPNQYALAVQSDNETMGYVSGSGTYDYLSNLTISVNTNYGYHFTYWNDGVAESARTITLTQDTTFTAFFAPNQYNLTAVSADESMGTVSGGGTYDFGDDVTVTATPVEHYHFLYWNDRYTENPRDIEIQCDSTFTAFFAIDTHTVSVVVNDIARGMVEATGTEFIYGTPCTVTATAYSGYEFVRWSNGVTYNPYTFAVLEDVDLMAVFEEEGTQGISDVGDINGIKIYTKGRSIHINGIEGQHVSVYSVDGRIIATKNNATEQESIPVPSTGVYFIKVGEYPARKVVVMK